MEINALQDIGLTQGETKVYLALVELGSTTTGPIAKKSGVSASKVYKVIDRLENKGLVGHITKDKTKYFHALDPGNIVNYIEEKQDDLEKKKEEIESLIPQIRKKMESKEQSDAIILSGFKAVTNYIWGVVDKLKTGDSYYVLSANYGDVPGLEEFFHKYHERRAKKGVKVKMLANFDNKKLVSPTKKKAEIRYLPQHLIGDMQIAFTDKITLIVVWRRSPIAFVIEDREVAKSFKSYFDAFWKIAKA
tara:strand:- start:924 stop:1667 length:744 start_codon:yes stop_codon:yes gene_type:complete